MTERPASLPPLALIVAVARNGVIGKGGVLPWHISEDLKPKFLLLKKALLSLSYYKKASAKMRLQNHRLNSTSVVIVDLQQQRGTEGKEQKQRSGIHCT